MKHTKTLSIIYRAERKRSPNGQTVPFFMKWGDNLNQTCASECIYVLVLDNDRTCIFFRWCFHMVEVQRHSTHRWMFEDQWSQKTPLRPPVLLENNWNQHSPSWSFSGQPLCFLHLAINRPTVSKSCTFSQQQGRSPSICFLLQWQPWQSSRAIALRKKPFKSILSSPEEEKEHASAPIRLLSGSRRLTKLFPANTSQQMCRVRDSRIPKRMDSLAGRWWWWWWWHLIFVYRDNRHQHVWLLQIMT